MKERSPLWQTISALLISTIVLISVGFTMWFVDRADESLLGKSPPLPSGLRPSSAYLLTIIIAILGITSGGVVLLAIRQVRYFAPGYAWVVSVLVGLPLVALLFVPLQRGGGPEFIGLPVFLLSLPARMVVAVSLGALFIGGIDLRKAMPGLVLESAAPPAPRASAGGGGGGGATVRGLTGRFTPNAWRALSAMQEEAQRFEHGYMGTEHLLLGILRDLRSQATRAIVNLGAEPGGMRAQLEGVIGRRGALSAGGSGMTPRCQRVIEGAARLARQSGQRTVSTGLLLQSLADSPEDVAGQLLESSGISADRVSQELRHLGPEAE